MINQEVLLDRFMALFPCSDRGHNKYFDRDGRTQTYNGTPPSRELFKGHLFSSGYHMGVTLVDEEGMTSVGILDYDYDDKPDWNKNSNQEDSKVGSNYSWGKIDLISLEADIRKKGLPLVVCRSKNGGAHAILFTKEPVQASKMKRLLSNYKAQLQGYGEDQTEIFPKQVILKKGMGSPISLPYNNSFKTLKYAIINGKVANFSQFLDHAESMKTTLEDMSDNTGFAHEGAPPCIQLLFKTKLSEGGRNIACFNVSVYARRAFPDNWEKVVHRYNDENIKNPLSYSEVCKIIESVAKTDEYRYKCNEEPVKSRCDSVICATVKYGITSSEKSSLALSNLPEIGRLRKYETKPPFYELEIEGKTLRLGSSDDLRMHHKFSKIVFEELDMVIGHVKKEAWDTVLDRLMQNLEKIEVPDEMSEDGVIRIELINHVMKANRWDTGDDKDMRKLLLGGQPIVQRFTGKRYVLFSMDRFLDRLGARGISQSRQHIYSIIKNLATHRRIKHEGSQVTFWQVELVGESDILEPVANKEYNAELSRELNTIEIKATLEGGL